jgi:Domain of unknown function (DUF1854)
MDSIRLSYDAFGRLVLVLSSGETHAGIVPIRAFPFSAPTEWISFCSEQGREVAAIADLRVLDHETRTLLERDLARREFLPVILRVFSVSAGAEPTQWHVETDRGDVHFSLTSEDQIRRLGPGVLILDAHGVRYQIPDISRLDALSRRAVRRYL